MDVGGTTQGYFPDTASQAPNSPYTQASVAQVNALQSNPVVKKALEKMEVKKFKGMVQDWERFARDWEEFLRVITVGGTLDRPTGLMLLSNHLDPASQALLRTRKAQNPRLSYWTFWDELRGKFTKDTQSTNRLNWTQIKVCRSGKKMLLEEWEEFCAHYVEARQKVTNWTVE